MLRHEICLTNQMIQGQAQQIIPLCLSTVSCSPLIHSGRVSVLYGSVTWRPLMVTSISSRIFFSSRIMALRSAEM